MVNERYYSIIVQVDFDKPRTVTAQSGSRGPFEAVGYFQQFFCTESSKEKAKQCIFNYIQEHEDKLEVCQFRYERVAWMRGLKNFDELSFIHGLTEDMFENRDEVAIWFVGEQGFYVSEEEYAKHMISTTPTSSNFNKLFTGLWSNEAGRVLLVTHKSGNTFDVSFAANKSSGPVSRIELGGELTLCMPAVWDEETGDLIVELGRKNESTEFHLTYDDSDFYGEGEYLVPALVTAEKDYRDKSHNVSWVEPLKEYSRVHGDEWADYVLLKHLKEFSSQ